MRTARPPRARRDQGRAHCVGFALVLAVAIGAAACADGVAADDLDATDAASPAAPASLTIDPTFGPGFGAQLDAEAVSNAALERPGALGDLLVLLCAVNDPTCVQPHVFLAVRDELEQWTRDPFGPVPLTATDGPRVRLDGLPPGRWLMMVVYDSAASQANGLPWNRTWPDGSARQGLCRSGAGKIDAVPWGGVASAGDMLLSASAAAAGFNPPPAPRQVVLRAGETRAVGEVYLAHYCAQSDGVQ